MADTINATLAEPVILFPLRLELRKVSVSTPVAKHAFRPVSDGKASLVQLQATASVHPPRPEYWVRWYPDDVMALAPPRAVSGEDEKAFERWRDSVGGADAFDLNIPRVNSAWQRLVEDVGVVRARYLVGYFTSRGWIDMEFAQKTSLESMLEEGLTVPLLPRWLRLYALDNNGNANLVAGPIEVDPGDELRVGALDIPGTEWMTAFEAALKLGMGTKIVEPAKVGLIDNAAWLLALGTPTRRERTLEHVLRGYRARGQLALVPQDAPTNNVEEGKTAFARLRTDLPTYIAATRDSLDDLARPEVRQLVPPPPTDPATRRHKKTRDAHLLSHLLRLDPGVFSEIPGTGLTEQLDADAMAELLWNCLQSGLRDRLNGLSGLSSPGLQGTQYDEHWNALGRFFIEHLRGCGPLPVLRAGPNPYGLLPVMPKGQWQVGGGHPPATAGLLKLLHALFSLLRDDFAYLAQTMPNLSTASPNQLYPQLIEALCRDRIAKGNNLRFDPNNSDPYLVACALAADLAPEGDPSIPPLGYLQAIADFQDGDTDLKVSNVLDLRERARNESLLHRLLVMHLERDSGDLSDEAIEKVKALRAPAQWLVQLPVDRVEILFCEVLDLLTHRLDAWLTAFATQRLLECRAFTQDHADVTDPHALGAYGWLERPGGIVEQPQASHYVQTPSTPQAACAGIMHNAALNNGDAPYAGPYQFNLNSRRVRDGQWFLEGLRQGHLPGELLGYRLERMIKAQAAANRASGANTDQDVRETDIFALRDLYRFPHNQPRPGTHGGDRLPLPVVVNGEAFLADNPQLTSNSVAPELAQRNFTAIRERLASLHDASADLLLAEACYQVVLGNSERAAACMDVLDGEVRPPELEFVRTRRSGAIHASRLALCLPVPLPTPPSQDADGNPLLQDPLLLADPVLAHLCMQVFPDWDTQNLVLRIGKKGETPNVELTVALEAELGLEPVHLVVGETSDLLHVARYYVLNQWRAATDPGFVITSVDYLVELGPFPVVGQEADLRNAFAIELVPPPSPDDEPGAVRSSDALNRAARLRRLLNRTRSADKPSTLDPDAEPRLPANRAAPDEQHTDLAATFALLRERVNALQAQLVDLRGALLLLLPQRDGDAVRMMPDDGLTVPERDALLDAFSAPFDSAMPLARLARYGFPQALTVVPAQPPPIPTPDLEQGGWALTRLASMLGSLETRLDKLDVLLGQLNTLDHPDHRKAGIAKATQAIALAIGRDGLPLQVPYVAQGGGWPVSFAEAGEPNDQGQAVQDELEPYTYVRPAVAEALDLFGSGTGLDWYARRQPVDPGPQTLYAIAPYSEQVDVQELALLLLDSWTEFIPNAEETTALSLHFPTPKSQAPNCILLVVPPKVTDSELWTPELLVDALRETIDLMRCRMVGPEEVMGDNNLGRYLPLLFVASGKQPVPIPVLEQLLSDEATDGSFAYRMASDFPQDQLEDPGVLARRSNYPDLE